MQVRNGWVYTEALFKGENSEYLDNIGIKTENEMTPFRFRLSLVECYNESIEGFTTVNIGNYRITVKILFEDFEKFIENN
jgi:hypothetical protein